MIPIIVIGIIIYYLTKQKASDRNDYEYIIYSGEQRAKRIANTLVFSDLIAQIAVPQKVDPASIAAIIATESEGLPCKYNQGSNDLYIGLMSVGYRTAQWLGYPGLPYVNTPECPPTTGLFIPEQNVLYGTKYFSYQYERYGKSLQYAVSAYQMGSVSSEGIKNPNYVKTVFDFIPDFRSHFRNKITNYDTLFPGGLWDPQAILV